jgi:hypothetical protein
MSELRLDTMMSLDGYAAGPERSVENPFGIGGMQLKGWLGAPEGLPRDARRGGRRGQRQHADRRELVRDRRREAEVLSPGAADGDRGRVGNTRPGSGTERARDAMTAIDRGASSFVTYDELGRPDLHAARSSPARLPLPTGGGTRRLR